MLYFKNVRIGQRFTIKAREGVFLKIDYEKYMKFGSNEIFEWTGKLVIKEIIKKRSAYIEFAQKYNIVIRTGYTLNRKTK